MTFLQPCNTNFSCPLGPHVFPLQIVNLLMQENNTLYYKSLDPFLS